MCFKKTFSTLWASLDANKHMRHSAYNDYAAECRVRFFNENGFTVDRWEKENFGPILFKEETNFLKEIKLGEDISVELYLEGLSQKAERFKLFHKIFRQNGMLAAELRVYGAWLDMKKRKLTIPPQDILTCLSVLEKTDNFEEVKMKTN